VLVCCRECIRLVNELGLPVEVIMLPSFAYEHKVFVGPFSRRYPKAQVPVGSSAGRLLLDHVQHSTSATDALGGSANCFCALSLASSRAATVHVCVQIYVAPEQWSFPLRLPSAFFGIFNSTSVRECERYPWSADFDHRVLTVNTSKGWALSLWPRRGSALYDIPFECWIRPSRADRQHQQRWSSNALLAQCRMSSSSTIICYLCCTASDQQRFWLSTPNCIVQCVSLYAGRSLSGGFSAVIPAAPLVPQENENNERMHANRLVVGVGPYSEVALFHKASRTLLLVDAAVAVPKQPPAVIPRWALADAGNSSNFFVRLLYGDASKKVG
jgi:Domain of unknown function (DUF4336)